VQCDKIRLPMSVQGSCVTSIAGPNGVAQLYEDEGRSFEVGNQVLISSHRKLLLSKAMVVNVAEKSEQDSDRQVLLRLNRHREAVQALDRSLD
jgi:hypothetical protein